MDILLRSILFLYYGHGARPFQLTCCNSNWKNVQMGKRCVKLDEGIKIIAMESSVPKLFTVLNNLDISCDL